MSSCRQVVVQREGATRVNAFVAADAREVHFSFIFSKPAFVLVVKYGHETSSDSSAMKVPTHSMFTSVWLATVAILSRAHGEVHAALSLVARAYTSVTMDQFDWQTWQHQIYRSSLMSGIVRTQLRKHNASRSGSRGVAQSR